MNLQRKWLDALSLGALFASLLAATWMRWPDALVDFWRNLYIPWRLSEGALLYVDVADWYGPLASLVTAAAFSLFGPGLDVLVALNVAVALGCLFTMHAVLLHVGDRLSAWVGSAVFVLVFCFGQYTLLGNYNFITPYVSQATWGFFGVLLTLEGALANTKEESPRAWWLAGAGLAIAWLSKAETLLAAAVVVFALTALRRRLPPLRFFLGFALVSVPVWLLLTAEGGVLYGLRAFNQVIIFTLSPDVRATLAAVPIFATDLGTDAPWINLVAHASRGAVLLGVMTLIAFAPWAFKRAPRVTVVMGFLLAVALVGLTDWLRVGRALLVPALLTCAGASAALLRGEKKWAPLWLLSLAALAMLARMALNVRVFHYGFTMAVLASMLVVHLLVFEAPRLRLTPPLGLPFAVSALVLAGSARLTLHSLEQHRAKTVTVGTGRDAFTAFAPEHQRHPGLVNDMLAAVEQHTPSAKTLVVFPDSAAVSYLARRPSPIPEFEFNPVSLGFSGVDPVLLKLQAHPPDVVLLCSYDLRSHGTPFFGANDASGRAIAAWVKANYVKVASGPPGPLSVTGHTWDLLTLRTQVTP
ncbi:MAG: hypothetical protein Q8N23_16315 [Archangium sp.]|nr:hypothetical protein [Archangium sp.]MDP3154242.1 hypothetical protein [Archangium sp.]MDP3575930.1 hypothetical protein [Archangium sp.]